MARGKNKAVAERRKQAVAELGTIDSQQNTIKKLQAEVEELKLKLEMKEQFYIENLAGLNYKLTENTSNIVEELRGLNDSLREELGEARANYDSIQRKWSKVFKNLRDHYMSAHGMKSVEAMERSTAMMGDNPNQQITLNTIENPSGKNMSSERVRALQRVQGVR